VSLWHAEGNANDSASGGNNATLQGGASFAPGEIGQGFSLNGTTAYVERVIATNLEPGPNSFTLSAWVNTTSNTRQMVLSKFQCGGACPAGANSLYFLEVAGDVGCFDIRDTPGVEQRICGTRLIADGAFHHLLAERNLTANTVQIYVDGTLDISATLTVLGSITDNDGEADPFIIGANRTAGQFTHELFFAGVIDEIAFYNRALSAAEVSALYHSIAGP
jgi:hypothetical protein